MHDSQKPDDPARSSSGSCGDPYRLLEIKLDYAWKYFESAARQRMLFLNYFVVLVGVLAGGYAVALRECLVSLAISLCAFGIVTTLAFVVFDYRMLAFVKRANRVLETMERRYIFPDGDHVWSVGESSRSKSAWQESTQTLSAR